MLDPRRPAPHLDTVTQLSQHSAHHTPQAQRSPQRAAAISPTALAPDRPATARPPTSVQLVFREPRASRPPSVRALLDARELQQHARRKVGTHKHDMQSGHVFEPPIRNVCVFFPIREDVLFQQ